MHWEFDPNKIRWISSLACNHVNNVLPGSPDRVVQCMEQCLIMWTALGLACLKKPIRSLKIEYCFCARSPGIKPELLVKSNGYLVTITNPTASFEVFGHCFWSRRRVPKEHKAVRPAPLLVATHQWWTGRLLEPVGALISRSAPYLYGKHNNLVDRDRLRSLVSSSSLRT
jgi:hypothetical protein